MKSPETLPFFFIIGRPRSGTYLLRNMFDAHPHVAIPTEGPVIANLYPKYGKKTTWTKKDIKHFLADVFRHKDIQKWPLNKSELEKALLAYAGKCTFQTLIKIVYLHFQSAFPKESIHLLGDKNPVYSTNTDKILKAFPDARFIHLTRDYRDNLVSIRKVDFEAPYTPLIVYRWRHSAKLLHALKRKYPHRFFTLRYEDLVREPEDSLQKVCRFLGIPFKESMLDFYKKQPQAFAKHPDKEVEKYHQSLTNPINTKKIGVWKESLPEKEIKMADAVAGKFAALAGYQRTYHQANYKTKIKSMPGILYGKSAYLFADFLDILPFRLRLKIKEAGSILAIVYNKLTGKM